MGNVAIVTSTAVSIFGQGKLLSRLLGANGIQNIVNMNIDMVSVLSYVTHNKVSNVFYFYDPFVLPHSTFGLPKRNVVNYWTADGVPANPLQRSYVRSMCNSGINVANDEFSKANMEAIGCHIDEVIHNAIDWNQLRKHINEHWLNNHPNPVNHGVLAEHLAQVRDELRNKLVNNLLRATGWASPNPVLNTHAPLIRVTHKLEKKKLGFKSCV